MLLEEWIVKVPIDMFDNLEEDGNYAIDSIKEEMDWRVPAEWNSWIIDIDEWDLTFSVTRLSRD